MLLPVFAGLTFAGTIQGTVWSGNSVEYIDAIAGKTFPAPTQNPVIDQKGLKFNPAVLVVQVGTTVDFQNDDTVQHNVFSPSVGRKQEGRTQSRYLAEGGEAFFQVRPARRGASVV